MGGEVPEIERGLPVLQFLIFQRVNRFPPSPRWPPPVKRITTDPQYRAAGQQAALLWPNNNYEGEIGRIKPERTRTTKHTQIGILLPPML